MAYAFSTRSRSRRIAITGATGFVGSRLVHRLESSGDQVYQLVRREPVSECEIYWNPSTGEVDATSLEGMDAVVHLSGESIAGGLWTRKRKEKIRSSRVEGTTLLVNTLANLQHPPRVLVSTSAIGYYGDGGAMPLTEDSAPGNDFLADVCVAWESAARPARDAGIRVVQPRFGLVLDGKGGILPLMALPFRLGLGGQIGPGDQYMSWIMLDDLVEILVEAIDNEALDGPVNAVAPDAVTNREFTAAMGRALHRPTVMKVPAFAAKAVGGELVEQLILVSQRVQPARLQPIGFRFRYPTIEDALAAAFDRRARSTKGTGEADRRETRPVTGD